MKQNHFLSFARPASKMVCRDCIVLTHPKAEGHELQELNEVKAEYVVSLEQLRIKVEDGVCRQQNNLSCLRVELDSMDIVTEVAMKEIDKSFDALVEVVNTRRQQVKDILKETHETRHRAVNELLVEVDNQTAQLKAIREQLDDATCKGQLRDLVDVATNQDLQQQIAAMIDIRELNLGKNYFTYNAKDAIKQLQQLMAKTGEIKDLCMLPAKISIENDVATACLETNILMKISTHTEEPLPRYPLTMAIVDPTGDEIHCETTDNHDGTYTVVFTPQISGAHLCTVQFLGQKILSSCTSVAVLSNDPVQVLGSMGKDEGMLMYPCSLKIDENGAMYVVDEGNQRIQKFHDEKVEIITVAGTNKAARTFDCAVDLKNDELICSKVIVEQRKAWANTIQIFFLDGTPKHQFTNPEMKKALYVAVNSSQQIIIPDYHLNTLFIYDHKGNLIDRVGQTGSGPGEFKEPAFVCIGHDDDIIISDCRNSRVQVLNKQGQFKYQIGTKGSGKGQLQGPSGVAIDKQGHILVTDRVNNRLQVYTYDGKFVSCIESCGNKLNDPRGLAVSSDGHVFVADQKNHCIKKFKYMHVAPNGSKLESVL
ncbi:hypothetical protein EB796_011107 [Bugula neritina]|uniref:TRIM71 n=1 Tax=Bugula neritina TaxID=10212 RepID=A0A7J7JVY2_BUGNE|nr:hypothetical protein EB796_011107 [Bugula neritina]